jgi:hypothetical protein
MAENNKIGLEAVFESSDFQQGIAAYNAAVSNSVGSTQSGSDKMASSFDSVSSAIDAMASETSSRISGMSMAISAAAAAAAGDSNAMASSFTSLSGAIDSMATATATSLTDMSGEISQIEDDSAEWADSAEADAEAFRASRDAIIESMYDTSDATSDSSTDMQDSLGDLDKKVTETKDNAEDDTASMADYFDALSGAGKVAFGALAAAIAAVTAELLLATSAALDTEKIMATSAFAIEKFGKNTGITSKDVDDLASSISKVEPIDDEVITQAITMGMTFDGVNKNNIEPLTKAAADLALFTGKDMVASMKSLGLAVTDPDKALRLFKEANITLTDAEKEHLKALKENGDQAKISSYIIGLVTDKVGGFGEALGKTAGGKITIMNTAIGNMHEALGAGFLTAVGNAADAVTRFASNPENLANLTTLGENLGFVANLVIEGSVGMATALSNNQGIIIGALAAITTALLLTAAAAVAVFIATVEISVPLLLIAAAIAVAAALIGAVVALVATAWTKNWGDIQGKTQAVWKVLQPIFNLIAQTIKTVVGVAIASLVIQWNALVATMTAVKNWIDVNLMPLLNAIANLIMAVVNVQLRAMAAAFDTVVSAATAVAKYLGKTLEPVFDSLGNLLDTYLMPILKPMADFLSGTFASAFGAIGSAVSGLITLINSLADALNALKIPDDLTPIESNLKGVNDELAKMANATLPAVKHQMEIVGTVRDVQNVSGRNGGSVVNTNNSSINNYLFNPKFGQNGNSGGMGALLEGLS